MKIKKKSQIKSQEVEVVTVTPDLTIIPRVDAPDILAEFQSRVEEFRDRALTLTVTSEDQVAEMKEAREIRLTLVKIRTAADAKRVELVGAAKKKLAAIDADFKAFKDKLTEMESRLVHQEKFLEYKEAARQAEIREEREKAVAFFGPLNPSINYAAMSEKDFDQHLAECEAARDFRVAEEERIAKQNLLNEQERIRLQQEADKLAEERKEIDRKNQEILDQQAAARLAEAKLKEEQEQALNAPDKQKLAMFGQLIRELIVPECKSEKAKLKAAEIQQKCRNFANWIDSQIEEI